MQVDYRRFEPGACLAPAIILTRCPLCGKACHERVTTRDTRYVHQVNIYRHVSEVSRRGSNRVEIIKSAMCRETPRVKEKRIVRETLDALQGKKFAPSERKTLDRLVREVGIDDVVALLSARADLPELQPSHP